MEAIKNVTFFFANGVMHQNYVLTLVRTIWAAFEIFWKKYCSYLKALQRLNWIDYLLLIAHKSIYREVLKREIKLNYWLADMKIFVSQVCTYSQFRPYKLVSVVGNHSDDSRGRKYLVPTYFLDELTILFQIVWKLLTTCKIYSNWLELTVDKVGYFLQITKFTM